MKKLIVLLLLGLLSLFQTQAQETNTTAEAKADTVRMTVEMKTAGMFQIDIFALGADFLMDWGDGSPIEVNECVGGLSMSHAYGEAGTYNIIVWTESVGQVEMIDVHESGEFLLTSLDVSGCTALENLHFPPGFSLTTLNASGCTALRHLNFPPDFSSLTTLNVSGCTALRYLNFPPDLSSLTTLNVSGCTALRYLNFPPDISSLTMLNVSGCTALTDLNFPPGFSSLTTLNMSGCTSLRMIHSFDILPLTSLDISGCTFSLNEPWGFEFDIMLLKTLRCANNGWTDVPIYPALEVLDCHGNQLQSMNVRERKTLVELNCSDNQLTDLDVSGCTKLSVLNCSNNPLTTLNASGCTALEELSLEDQSLLTSLNVSGCTALETLYCQDNQLTTLNVRGCTALKTLYCYNNPLEELDVNDCRSLWYLDVSDCAALNELIFSKQKYLTDLNVRGCTALKKLYCDNNILGDLDVSSCTSLRTLYCWNNPLWRLDVSGLTELKVLSCGKNLRMTSLDVSGCTALDSLECAYNSLTSLDVSDLTELKWLSCNNNPLTMLEVNGCNKLNSVNASRTSLSDVAFWVRGISSLTNLDISFCTTLNYLNCQDNQLTNLNVSGCTALETLYCQNNQLTNLNVSGCTALERLYCGNNSLTSLDVTHNANLQALDCGGNQLRSLDLSGNEQYGSVQCADNHIPLSHLYPLMARRTTWTNYLFSPQSDTVSLEGGEVFDLSKEMQFGTSATKWSVHKLDGSAVASGTFEETNGKFRFLKKGDYRLVLQNDSVRQQYLNNVGLIEDESVVVFTWVVKVLSTQAPKQDTILMKVVGTSAEFSFTADKTAMYYVDWGDGKPAEKQACTAGEEKTLTHTYTDSNTYDITFFVYEKPEPTDYTEPFAGIDMVWVKGDTFYMGATTEQGSDAYDWEKPAHKVTLSSYYISKYEITQAQWKAVMGTTIEEQAAKALSDMGARLFGVGDNYPMYYVSWNDAKTFCEKLSQKTGKNYALPTEAQWEFAARGGTKSEGHKYSGSDTVGDVAWYDENSDWSTHTVGTKKANELGIHDMGGNVWEWCADYWYDAYSSDAVTNPMGPNSGYDRVIRGSALNNGGIYCRVSYRNSSGPDDRNYYLGFRVVCLP